MRELGIAVLIGLGLLFLGPIVQSLPEKWYLPICIGSAIVTIFVLTVIGNRRQVRQNRKGQIKDEDE